jgi:acetyltransferase-like isoleucine patch superfamily enzyme
MYKVLQNVEIGSGAQIGDYVLIGVPPRGRKEGELATRIGKNALIRSHTVIYAGNSIGDNFETGHHVMVREENRIGDRVSIGTLSVVEHHVTIGNGVRIHSQSFVPEYTVLEEGCMIGPNCVFTNVLHPLCPKAKECMKGATVKRGAKICANATISPNITIGEMAVVGAGAVVLADVPARAVVVGNPARIIKTIDELTCPFNLIENPYITDP